MYISGLFSPAMIFGGYLSGSMAIYMSAASLVTDMVSAIIAIIALCLIKRENNDKMTYGWHRAEIIGMLVSISMIWIIAIWLITKSV